jgi:hypothetical protein
MVVKQRYHFLGLLTPKEGKVCRLGPFIYLAKIKMAELAVGHE